MTVPIVAHVDLRAHLQPARDQGPVRPTCLAFAASDAHALEHDLNDELSPEFLYYWATQSPSFSSATNGLTFEAANYALQNYGQPFEREWPYSATPPTSSIPPTGFANLFFAACAWRESADYQDAIAHVQCARPVVFGISLSRRFIEGTIYPYIIESVPAEPAFGKHAVLAVGHGESPVSGEIVLVRNSWGTHWCDQGYAWLPRSYLENHYIGYLLVDVI